MEPEARPIAHALATVVRRVSLQHGVTDVLQGLVVGAVEAFPEIDHAGVSLVHKNGTIETVAATDALVGELDDLQYSLREGPCYESITQQLISVSQNSQHEQRWPRYIARATDLGLRAQFAVRLYTEATTLGGLNLYSTTSDTIGDDTLMMAEIFASHTAAALGRAKTEQEVTSALVTRQVIGQATGIVMERYGLSEADAFHYLVRISSSSNVKLREVARRLVEGV